MPPPKHAIIVGINQYPPPFEHLKSASQDAKKLSDCLVKLGLEQEKIKLLLDGEATKAAIIKAILSLGTVAKRNEAIVFFFSGYAGEAGNEGIICPFDVSEESSEAGALSTKELSQIFSKLARSIGNNITLLLDCSSKAFDWGDPSSFVVVAPDSASETPNGGAFTQAVIKVLGDDPKSLDAITFQSFAGYVQAAMVSVKVNAIGVNITRPLFDSKGEKSHHALIPGYTDEEGHIRLRAGAAHGVRVGAVYGIYKSNIRRYLDRIGSLVINSLDDDDITSTFQDSPLQVPNFFHASEEGQYCNPISTYIGGEAAGDFDIKKFSGCSHEANLIYAPLIAQVHKDHVCFVYTGQPDDCDSTLKAELTTSGRLQDDNAVLHSEDEEVQRVINRAARFHHIVAVNPPTKSSIANGLRVYLEEAETTAIQNLLNSDKFVPESRLALTSKASENENTLGPYNLRIVNKNPFPVWPYVFMCDPENLTITPWYLPIIGSKKTPLGHDMQLVIGKDEEEGRLILQHQANRPIDLTYIRIFVTKDPTDFSCIQQWYRSPAEDQVRAYSKTLGGLKSPSIQESNLVDTVTNLSLNKRKIQKISHWATMQISIRLSEEATVSTDESEIESVESQDAANEVQDAQ